MRAARNILDLVLMSRNALPSEASRNGREKDPVRLTAACDISVGKQYQTAKSISVRGWPNQIHSTQKGPGLAETRNRYVRWRIESLDI